MDYGKLNKNELIKLCEERKLSFSSSWTKERLEELLIDDDKDNKKLFKNKKIKIKDNKIGKIGSIINIVFSSISLLLCILSIIVMFIASISIFNIINSELSFDYLIGGIVWLYIVILLFTTIGLILTIISNYRYYKGENNKVMAGILGLIFSGIIGGILVLLGD